MHTVNSSLAYGEFYIFIELFRVVSGLFRVASYPSHLVTLHHPLERRPSARTSACDSARTYLQLLFGMPVPKALAFTLITLQTPRASKSEPSTQATFKFRDRVSKAAFRNFTQGAATSIWPS